jgi:hypothetical protein
MRRALANFLYRSLPLRFAAIFSVYFETYFAELCHVRREEHRQICTGCPVLGQQDELVFHSSLGNATTEHCQLNYVFYAWIFLISVMPFDFWLNSILTSKPYQAMVPAQLLRLECFRYFVTLTLAKVLTFSESAEETGL